MKKLFCLSVMAMLLSMQGCVTDDLGFGVGSDQTAAPKVQIWGDIHQQTTRVDSDGFCEGDEVGLFLVNYDGETAGELVLEGNQADNVKFTLSEDGSWVSEYDIFYKDNDTKVDFYGYYPYAEPTSIEAYAYEVAKDQRTPAEHGQMAAYEASDFLWAKTENIAPTEGRVTLKFHHKMSSARVRFTQGEGWADAAEFAAVKKEVLVTSTIRKATIDLATGEVAPTGEKPLDGIIPIEDGGEFRAIVVPQTVDAGEELLVITIDGHPRKFVRGEATEYLPGKITNFDLAIKKGTNAGEYEVELVGVNITAWEADNVSHQDDAREYVVVHCPAAGQLERTMVDRMELDITKIKNLKLTGKIGRDDYTFMKGKMTSLMRLNIKEVESLIDGVYKIPSNAFSGKTSLIKCVFPDKLEIIDYKAFHETSLTGTLQLPEGLKHLDGFGRTKITNINFPSTLEEIGEDFANFGAFEYCSSLMCEISLPASVKRLYRYAFRSAAIKGNLALPEGLEYIGDSAFSSCSGLTGSLTIPSGVHVIYSSAFSSCGFTGNLTLPMGLTEIQSSAFRGTKFKGELNIPSTVTTIGNTAFAGTEFNGALILPKELITIGSSVFSDCWRLSGVVEIPENIVAISSGLFSGCWGLEGVVLHKDVEVIESGAFEKCYGLNSIVCKAKIPPTINSNTFNGVAKDNFALEVPESSVKQYQFASGWSEFKRIAAHRDFTISRNLLRTLKGEHSKIFTLRAPAGEAWSVESAPEWVTVTPSSGEGKMDVTITVNEMAAADVSTFTIETLGKNSWGSMETIKTTHAGRAGEVVFLLNGKDCRTRMTVEQYDYQYNDGDMLTHQTATVGNGVNIVLMGDCFDAKDISEGKYLKAMEDAYSYFFDIEPYKTYKEYFNVYSVFGMSADSGMGTVNTIREARFGSQYTLNEGVSPDFNTVFAGACTAPINDDVAKTLVILVENSNEYSGLCYMWGDGSAVAIVPMSTDPAPYDFQGLVHHEAGGHGFGKLADEYIYHNAFIQSCSCICCGHVADINLYKSYGFYSNISLTGSMQSVPWSHMIYDPQFSNVVDVYEGAYMHTRGVFRSEATSCMNNNIAYYNAISREAMVKRIMAYAGEEYSFEAFKAKDYESLPSTAVRASVKWDGESAVSHSRYDQRAPKFMGEKPQFDKNRF